MYNTSIKNTRIVSLKSKNATVGHPLMLYYNYKTNEVLTEDMIGEDRTSIYCLQIELIRYNTPSEIKETVVWALSL